MQILRKLSILAIVCLLELCIVNVLPGQETDQIQFDAYLGLGEYSLDTGYMGLDDPLAKMQVHVYGMLDLTLAEVTMEGYAWATNGSIGVTGTPGGESSLIILALNMEHSPTMAYRFLAWTMNSIC